MENDKSYKLQPKKSVNAHDWHHNKTNKRRGGGGGGGGGQGK